MLVLDKGIQKTGEGRTRSLLIGTSVGTLQDSTAGLHDDAKHFAVEKTLSLVKDNFSDPKW